MKIPILTKLIQRRGKRQLRYILRGYRFLKNSDQLNKISSVKVMLTNTRLGQTNGLISKWIMGAGLNHAELIIRQYLLIRIGGLNLNKALLYSLGKPGAKVLHPLPYEWRDVLRQNKFKVAGGTCALLFGMYVTLLLAFGLTILLRQFWGCLKEIIQPKFSALRRFVYFESLSAKTLPQSGRVDSDDIVSWYQQWSGRVSSYDKICHSVRNVPSYNTACGIPVISIPSAILPLREVSALIRFMAWGCIAIIVTIGGLLRGRWWHALLFNQAVLAKQMRLQNSELIAKDYLFHNSNWIYRPLWTYEAEKCGARISFYFYSTNTEVFEQLKHLGKDQIFYGWQAMSWSYYLVWDKYQADFIRRAVGEKAYISIVGPIWFNTSEIEIQKLPPKAVAVFDVQPMRDTFYCTLGLDFEYYTPYTACQFLSDIYSVMQSYEATTILKRKRQIGRLAHPKYRTFIKELVERSCFVSIDPDASALQLIKESMAVISMPFTSTALIARELGKPSVYYDPHGLIQKDDRGAHGIEILCGLQELRAWVSAVVTKDIPAMALAVGVPAKIIRYRKQEEFINE